MRIARLIAIFMLFWLAGVGGGCSLLGYTEALLTVTITNDNNQLLAVEGRSNLPDATPVRITLSEDGSSLVQNQTSLQKGSFVSTLDLGMVPGNSALSLEVALEPANGPESVRRQTGEYGQYLIGSQVEEEGKNYRVVERLRLVLPMNRREAAIRRVQMGNYGPGVAALEDVLAVDPQNPELQGWLAVALLNRDPLEDVYGSRAYTLLEKIEPRQLSALLRQRSAHWRARLALLRSEYQKKAQRQEEIERHKAILAARKLEIVAGKSLGGVDLGLSAASVYEMAVPEKYPLWRGEVIFYNMPDRPVSVYFDAKSGRVIELNTESPEYLLAGKLRVGSPLSDVELIYPEGHLNMGMDRQLSDGNLMAYGEYSCPQGLIFHIKRISMVDGLILSDQVESISVVPPFEWVYDEDTRAEAEAEAAQEMVQQGSYPRAE